ncbi:hypothetical protein SNEBB_008819 [Seison nebaliae]|nr:hypothetical protein SNEBB_008819 [Seison nebaliae]
MYRPKFCAKCAKNVYPLEELKCLDKIWHKTCFRCVTCNMLLNVKNYKGFEKEPYCQSHLPRISHSAVADNPEMQRIKRNTEIQSSVKYHADFNQTIRGQKTSIVNDPETERLKQNQQFVSQSVYHKNFNKSRFSHDEGKETTSIKPMRKSVDIPTKYNNVITFNVNESNGVSSSIINKLRPSLDCASIEKVVPARTIGSIFDYNPTNEDVVSKDLIKKCIEKQHFNNSNETSTSEKNEISVKNDHQKMDNNTTENIITKLDHANKNIVNENSIEINDNHLKSKNRIEIKENHLKTEDKIEINGNNEKKMEKVDETKSCETIIIDGNIKEIKKKNENSKNHQETTEYDWIILDGKEVSPNDSNTQSDGNDSAYASTIAMTSNSKGSKPNFEATYEAIYDRDGSDSTELSFRVGDRFQSCELIGSGWWNVISIDNGISGLVPDCYLHILP